MRFLTVTARVLMANIPLLVLMSTVRISMKLSASHGAMTAERQQQKLKA
jgi:hypothetical protein